MLTDITINNYTIVNSLHLNLEAGLSVLSGETGAGKSIIVDAVSLALGARGDTQAIRTGTERCDITLCFDLSDNPKAKQWLIDNNFSDENDCIISRSISRDGRSRSSINGRPCPQSIVRQLAPQLLVIHGQHQHQALLKRETQEKKLDEFAKNQSLLEGIQKIYQTWRAQHLELDTLKQQSQERDQQLSLLRYQYQELEELDLKESEWQELHAEHQQCHNAKELLVNLSQAIDLTVENERASAIHLLQQAIEQVNEIKVDDPQISSINKLLNSAAIHLQEAGDELHSYRNTLNLSPEHLAQVESRLTVIHDLARKHHVNPDALTDVKNSLQQKISDLENIDDRIAAIESELNTLLKEYQQLAKKLSTKRQKAAKELNQQITDSMQQLGMKGGCFTIKLDPIDQGISAHGNEKVTFYTRTNPGQDLQPMQKVVSGGELSRISLALQVLSSEKENIPSFIFDEVDVGIGGKTAEIVGALLRTLGETAQVFCITHLPQVASQGHHHFKVEKSSSKNSTHTTINLLSTQQRVDELARMISGSQISKETLKHAKQMLA